MTSYARADAAKRAGVAAAYLDRLIELGIVTPDFEGRLDAGNVRRAQLAGTLERSGLSLEDLATGIRQGLLTLSFVDAPIFERFATYSDETFAQLSQRTGVPINLLMLIRETSGGASPAPDDLVREDELDIVPFIQAQLTIGFQPLSIQRWLRVAGESLRRIAETESDAWRRDLMEPVFRRGGTAAELSETSLSPDAVRLDETTNEALFGMFRARQVHTWMSNILGGFEQQLTQAGLLSMPDRPPAICFLDITGYTRLTFEQGDDAAADLAGELGQLVQRSAADHGGRPVKWLGDGVMVYFPDAPPSVLASLDMVEAVAAAELPPAHVGIHCGPVLFQEGDYFGQTVNIAARIADYARPGEVLTTKEVADASAIADVSFTDVGDVELKGLSAPVHLFSARRASPGRQASG